MPLVALARFPAEVVASLFLASPAHHCSCIGLKDAFWSRIAGAGLPQSMVVKVRTVVVTPVLKKRCHCWQGKRVCWVEEVKMKCSAAMYPHLLSDQSPEIPCEAASPRIARALSSSRLSAGTELGPPPVLSRSLRTAAPLALAALAKSCHFLRITSHCLNGQEPDAANFMAMLSQSSFFFF